MSKTIEQLRSQASQIEEASMQGENTQLRVGGLFTDIIDFIAQIPATETILGPLLKALNNSGLIDPEDGQTLVFSIMKDGWTFSDELTQLKIGLGQISSTVTSNYEAFNRYKDLFQQEIDAVDQRVRDYKTGYDNDKIEYGTWKSQTDRSIGTFAAALTVDGEIVSMSQVLQTAFDISTQVTNNKKAADNAFEKLFDIAGIGLTDEASASWLYQNRQGITLAAATFDENGNIDRQSKIGVSLAEKVDENGVRTLISQAEISGDQIIMTSDFLNVISRSIDISADDINWVFTNAVTWYARWGTIDRPVMELDSSGNLTIMGQLSTNSEIIRGSGVYAGDLVTIFSSMVNGFKAHTISITGDTTYLNFYDGAVQAITKVTYQQTKTVYLPTLSDFRNILQKGSYEDFSCQFTIINQAEITSNTYDKDDVWVKGGTHDYDATITSGSARPRIMRSDTTSPYDVQLQTRRTSIFFITYINQKFIANYILG